VGCGGGDLKWEEGKRWRDGWNSTFEKENNNNILGLGLLLNKKFFI